MCSGHSGNPGNLRLLCTIRLHVVWANWEVFKYSAFLLSTLYIGWDTFFSWDGAQDTLKAKFKVQSLRKEN